jgi:nitroimidazol reductase NimA-like FMN-containing flavoprotein (pyridoxamine 5'-phosphate oxidase superfamily)
VSQPIGLSVLPLGECRRLITTADIGRVIVSMNALPAALPVTYRVVGDDIVFRIAPGTKLIAAVNNSVVGFEIDEIDSKARAGWSVLVVGISKVVTDPDEITALQRADIQSWLPTDLPQFVKIPIEHISGRRLISPTP